MKIAFDAKRAYHNSRGLGNYSRDTIRLLSSYFPENEYILFNPTTKRNLKFPLNKNTTEISPQSWGGKLFPSVWRSSGICRDIEQNHVDIYHGLSQELPWGISRKKVHSVVTMHDAIFMRYPELYSSSYRAIFIQKNNYACRTADRIIAISEQTKDDIIRYFKADERKISVVYQGCNSIFRDTITAEKKMQVIQKYNLPAQFLLNVGAIEERKNAAIIVEGLYRKKIETPLVIIGKPTPYIEQIKLLIDNYKMQNQVFFIHNAATEDLPAIYALAEIFIYPSAFEGFGIPILEALCTQTPVITSVGSCFAETGGSSSIYVNPNDAYELGDAIIHINSNIELQNKMRKDGLLFSENFTDARVANNLMEVYYSFNG